MPTPPDFRMQNNFPVATVIDAAQRQAQLQEQSRQYNDNLALDSLDKISKIGQSLVDRKRSIAQSLALGRQFDIPDDLAKTMEPDQVLKVGAIKRGYIPADTFLQGIHAQMAGTAPGAQSGAMPASSSSATSNVPPSATSGPMLTSNTTQSPIQPVPLPPPVSQPALPSSAQQPGGVPPPQAGSSMPVPIPAPPAKPRMLNPAEQKFLQHTADIAIKNNTANKPEPVMSKEAALAAGNVPHGTRIVEPTSTNSDKKEQDAYWRDAVRGLQSIRGDIAMKDIEAQRTAATTAYNRLKDIEYSGKAPNPIDYIDILGQVYKARTGAAPTQEVLKEAKQNTSAAALGKFWTFASGQQMPGTSKDIAASLKDMVAHMGLQADELHDGYMQVHGHEVFNPNMTEENVKKLSKLSRGKSFTEATGVKPEDFDVHLQAIKWAQANPKDPRSAPILQKALQEKSVSGGGSIGL